MVVDSETIVVLATRLDDRSQCDSRHSVTVTLCSDFFAAVELDERSESAGISARTFISVVCYLGSFRT